MVMRAEYKIDGAEFFNRNRWWHHPDMRQRSTLVLFSEGIRQVRVDQNGRSTNPAWPSQYSERPGGAGFARRRASVPENGYASSRTVMSSLKHRQKIIDRGDGGAVNTLFRESTDMACGNHVRMAR
jgi:hypothetical protein